MISEKKLSHIQRWILVEAYKEILNVGSEPKKSYDKPFGSKEVQILRIDVLQRYFKMPIRKQNTYGGSDSRLVIDTAAVEPEKANAARTALTRSFGRLKERGLISDSIKLTLRGIEVAKELSAK